MLPNEGIGGGSPAPRKLNVASIRIASPICKVSSTIKTLNQWAAVVAPSPLSLRVSASSRATRANLGAKIRVTACTVFNKLHPLTTTSTVST